MQGSFLALQATAFGLIVAIASLVSYNFCIEFTQTKIQEFKSIKGIAYEE